MAHRMTKDDFLYRQLKGEASLYRGLAFVYGALAVACVVMAVAAAVTDKGLNPILWLLTTGVGVGSLCRFDWKLHRSYRAALDEIGPDPTGMDTCKTYSAATAQAIAEMRLPSKELLQKWVAYGILALTLLLMGSLLSALFIFDTNSWELIYVLVAAGMVAGGFLLLTMTVKAFISWRAARYLEQAE